MGVNQCNIALGEERGGGALGMLTDDLLCYTFEFLDFSDLSSVRQVCQVTRWLGAWQMANWRQATVGHGDPLSAAEEEAFERKKYDNRLFDAQRRQRTRRRRANQERGCGRLALEQVDEESDVSGSECEA